MKSSGIVIGHGWLVTPPSTTIQRRQAGADRSLCWMLSLQMFARTCIYINVQRPHKQVCRFVSNQLYARNILSMSTFTLLKSDEMSGETDGTKSRTSAIKPSRSQYMLIEDVENLHRYRPGGYHRIQIGDNLNEGRYCLVDKLGYGEYSTIWLARDLQRARYVALKAITADASTYTPEASLINSFGNRRLGRAEKYFHASSTKFGLVIPMGIIDVSSLPQHI